MSCSNCRPSDVKPQKSPFKETLRLTGEYEHENVSLAVCYFCGENALYYSADVYDDFWQYWCVIDEVEMASILEDDDPSDPHRPERAREILRKRAVLLKHPVRGLSWASGGICVIEGPPW